MKNLIIAAITICATLCSEPEGSTHSIAYLVNNSQHSIKIFYYNKDASAVLKDTVRLLPNQQFKIADRSERGKHELRRRFDPYYRADSAIVIYDNTYKVLHYSRNPTVLPSGKYYSNSHKRNIFIAQNFRYTSQPFDKHSVDTEYFFEFTDQDYLDAK